MANGLCSHFAIEFNFIRFGNKGNYPKWYSAKTLNF